jgi:mRNA interferase MazF
MQKFIKRFQEWFGLKEEIDISISKPPSFREREIWMSYIGENIGFEMSGKNSKFHRPVIILHKFNKRLFFGIPTSTKIKPNNKFYIPFIYQGKEYSALISQMRVFDVKRLHYRKGIISPQDFDNIKESFLRIFKK